jgi:hypothetical protein
MKKAIVFLAVALALPTSIALAAGQPGTHGKSNPQVKYVLKGTLSGYQAATADTPGSITISVKHANYHAKKLVGLNLTFSTSTTTRVTFTNGATTISDGAKGILKFRAPLLRKGSTTLATTLTTNAKALHIIDQSRH